MRARRIISALMLLAVLLAGQALAVARGQGAAVGQMVICTGFGTQVVALDAEGNPVSAPHLCPDGLAALVEAHLPPPALILREGAVWQAGGAAEAVSVAWLRREGAQARGPPLA